MGRHFLTRAAAMGIALIAFACASPTASRSPLPPPALTAAPSPEPSAPAPAGITETDWGPIRDALPPGFPIYPGARPTETGEGPASGMFDVPADVATVATWFQAELERAGFSTLAQSGPHEDGSVVIESVRPPGDCAIQTTIAPLGGTTVVTILYGAACPAT